MASTVRPEPDDSANWDSLLAELINDHDHGLLLFDSPEEMVKATLTTLRSPKEYPTVCPDEGCNPVDAPICYDDRPANRVAVSIDLARAASRSEAKELLNRIAVTRGVKLYGSVYSTARKWYCMAAVGQDTGRESTYTAVNPIPPPGGV